MPQQTLKRPLINCKKNMFPISTLSHQLWNYCFDFMCFMDLSETKQPSHSSCSWIAYNIRPCLCPLYISALHALASLDRIKVACSAASYRRVASSTDVCSTIHVTHLQMYLFLPYVNSYHWKRAFSTHVMVWCQGMKNYESWSVPQTPKLSQDIPSMLSWTQIWKTMNNVIEYITHKFTSCNLSFTHVWKFTSDLKFQSTTKTPRCFPPGRSHPHQSGLSKMLECTRLAKTTAVHSSSRPVQDPAWLGNMACQAIQHASKWNTNKNHALCDWVLDVFGKPISASPAALWVEPTAFGHQTDAHIYAWMGMTRRVSKPNASPVSQQFLWHSVLPTLQTTRPSFEAYGPMDVCGLVGPFLQCGPRAWQQLHITIPKSRKNTKHRPIPFCSHLYPNSVSMNIYEYIRA